MATTTSAPQSSPQTAPPAQSASLYVGDLAPEVTEPDLNGVFSAIGPLESVRVCRDSSTRRSLGYAYVNFYKVEDAERALDTLNFKPIRDRPCRIMWSHRDPSLRKSGVGNIYVKNLAKTIDNKTLFDTFSVFGNILSCKVAYSPKGDHLGYAFVHFETAQAATDAIARVDGKVIADEKVSVMAFKSKKDRGVDKKTRFTNLYVKNLPADMSKEKLDELFRKHGNITSSMLALDKGEKKRGAFAFINFAAPEEANAAMVALNNFEVDKEHKMYVGRAQKKEERMKELRQRFEAAKAERIKKWQGVNLYVKNLPDDWTDEKLVAEFKHCGAISSTKVMRDSATQKSRGFGFVCFTTPDEAQKAVSDMNGKQVDGKPLYVALAQRKEIRRATLENRRVQRGGNMGFGQGPQMGYPPNPMFYGDNRGGFPGMGYGGGMGRGWGPMQGGQGNMMGPRQGGYGGGFNPNMMGRGGPQGAGSPGGRGGRGGGRGGPRGGGQAGPGMGRGMGRGMGQPPGPGGRGEFKDQPPQVQYADNVRNPQARPMQQPPAMQQNMQPEAMLPRQQGEPLTIKALAAAPEKQQKQMIGEQLFPRIKGIEPKLAGKITGMLLEMDNGELIHLLESQEALVEKVLEAKDVLEGHEQAANQDDQQDE